MANGEPAVLWSVLWDQGWSYHVGVEPARRSKPQKSICPDCYEHGTDEIAYDPDDVGKRDPAEDSEERHESHDVFVIAHENRA